MQLIFVAAAAAVAVAQSYAPTHVDCPSTLLRLAGTPGQANQTLSSGEAAYVAGRKALLPAAISDYLGGLASTVYAGDINAATTDELPTISISISGGGVRAALYGAGVLRALDGRESTSAPGTGGLLQAATYMSALSGGSWMLLSLVQHDFPKLGDLVLGNSAAGTEGWALDKDIFAPGTPNQQKVFAAEIFADLIAKRSAGFPVSFGDYWARGLSYHFLPGTTSANFFTKDAPNHAAALTFSSVTSLPAFQNHLAPFPIIVGDAYSVNRFPGDVGYVPLTRTVYEINPIEFGSFDTHLATFLPTSLLGTQLNSGTPSSPHACVNGYDNQGFVMGASSNLFDFYNVSNIATWTSPASPLYAAWNLINSTFYSVQPGEQMDISAVPNPFMGLNAAEYEDSNQTQLRLIDGGFNGEVDPIPPLVVAARKVDIIIVAASSADTDTNTPDGTALVASGARMLALPDNKDSLPPLPTSSGTFVSQGLNLRPTFFGCKGTPPTLSGKTVVSPYPIIVYLPNADPTGVTNTSTSQLVYSLDAATLFLATASNLTVRGIPTADGGADPLWPTALACAVVERTRGRTGVDITSACASLFAKYCWNELEGTAGSPATSSIVPGTTATTVSANISTVVGTAASTTSSVVAVVSGTSSGSSSSAGGTIVKLSTTVVGSATSAGAQGSAPTLASSAQGRRIFSVGASAFAGLGLVLFFV